MNVTGTTHAHIASVENAAKVFYLPITKEVPLLSTLTKLRVRDRVHPPPFITHHLCHTEAPHTLIYLYLQIVTSNTRMYKLLPPLFPSFNRDIESIFSFYGSLPQHPKQPSMT